MTPISNIILIHALHSIMKNILYLPSHYAFTLTLLGRRNQKYEKLFRLVGRVLSTRHCTFNTPPATNGQVLKHVMVRISYVKLRRLISCHVRVFCVCHFIFNLFKESSVIGHISCQKPWLYCSRNTSFHDRHLDIADDGIFKCCEIRITIY